MVWSEGDEEVGEGGNVFRVEVGDGEEGDEVGGVVEVVDKADELVVEGQRLNDLDLLLGGFVQVRKHLDEVGSKWVC